MFGMLVFLVAFCIKKCKKKLSERSKITRRHILSAQLVTTTTPALPEQKAFYNARQTTVEIREVQRQSLKSQMVPSLLKHPELKGVLSQTVVEIREMAMETPQVHKQQHTHCSEKEN